MLLDFFQVIRTYKKMAGAEPFEVVISGIGGKFPESNQLEQLKANLFGKVDMITVDDRRWPPGKLTLYKTNCSCITKLNLMVVILQDSKLRSVTYQ